MIDKPPSKAPEIEVQARRESVIRVYDPPADIAPGGEGQGFRDFPAFKIDFTPGGDMVLYGMKYYGRKVDLKTGREYDDARQTILAVVDPNGHLRAETVQVEKPADAAAEGLN